MIAALALVAALCGCGGVEASAPEPRAVTSDEAQLLAIARFQNFEARTRGFVTSFTLSGVEVTMRGWIDYSAKLGYATVTGDFGAEAVLWTDTSLGAIAREPDAGGMPALPIPATDDPGWQVQRLDASTSALHAIVATLSALGSDRPDNPLLLQQSGALWLRSDTVDDVVVTVFAAPASDEPLAAGETPDPEAATLRLWLDETGLMHRAELFVNNEWSLVEFSAETGPELSLPETAP